MKASAAYPPPTPLPDPHPTCWLPDAHALRAQLTTAIREAVYIEAGGYAEYIITVSADGNQWTVRQRYSDFHELQGKLLKSVVLPPFPAKKWFGNSSPAVIEQRRGELNRWLSAAAASPEFTSDPAFLAFLSVPLPSPVLRASGVAPQQSDGSSGSGADGGGGHGRRDEGGEPAGQAQPDPATMDDEEFADHLLEQTQALLVDVAEIPRPLEGEEVHSRMDAYSDEISELPLRLPATANRAARGGSRGGVAVSQGFGLPLPPNSALPVGQGVRGLLEAPSTATADKEMMAAVRRAGTLLGEGLEALGAPVPGALPLLVALPTTGAYASCAATLCNRPCNGVMDRSI